MSILKSSTHPRVPTDLHVMFIDDEQNILNSIKRSLRKEPYHLIIMNNATEALDYLKDHQVEVIISDQRMPEMTGIELFKQIKRQWPQTYRILLSGYTEVDTIIKAINDGEIYKFITKPWNELELKVHIQRALEQFMLQAEVKCMEHTVALQNEELLKLNNQLEARASDAVFGLSTTQELVDDIDAGIILIDSNSMIVNCNKIAKTIFESNQSVIGMNYNSLLDIQLCEYINDFNDSNKSHSAFNFQYQKQALQIKLKKQFNPNDPNAILISVWEASTCVTV